MRTPTSVLLLLLVLVVCTLAVHSAVNEDEAVLAQSLNAVQEELDNDAAGSQDDMESEGDDALLDLKSSIRAKLGAKWAIEEKDKAACCQAAFALCELPPGMTQLAFKKQTKQHLSQAKKACAPLHTVNMRNVRQICAFYSNEVNCAITPNTAADFDLYFSSLQTCCDSSNTYCKNKTDQGLYDAKRACLGFAARTEDELCEFSQSKECYSGSP
jgi:hypothetical protein